MNTESDNIQTTINNTKMIVGAHIDRQFVEQVGRGLINATTASLPVSGAAKIVAESGGCSDCETIKKYLRDRFDEISRINGPRGIPTASSFSTIMTYIGFLSVLMYGDKPKQDALNYTKFCNEYLKELRCVKKESARNGALEKRKNPNEEIEKKALVNTWGEILYSMVRCGLVHGMTVVGRNSKQNQVRIYLTHSKLKDAKTEKFKINGKPVKVVGATDRVEITISAQDLLRSVDSALNRLFQAQIFMDNAVAYLKDHPVIVAREKSEANAASERSAIYVKKNTDGEDAPSEKPDL